jgi:hypothetical protein
VAVGEVGVGLDELADGGIHLLAVGVGLGKLGHSISFLDMSSQRISSTPVSKMRSK